MDSEGHKRAVVITDIVKAPTLSTETSSKCCFSKALYIIVFVKRYSCVLLGLLCDNTQNRINKQDYTETGNSRHNKLNLFYPDNSAFFISLTPKCLMWQVINERSRSSNLSLVVFVGLFLQRPSSILSGNFFNWNSSCILQCNYMDIDESVEGVS